MAAKFAGRVFWPVLSSEGETIRLTFVGPEMDRTDGLDTRSDISDVSTHSR